MSGVHAGAAGHAARGHAGISPTIAKTMIELGLRIDIRVFPTLKSALQYAIHERDERKPGAREQSREQA